VALAIASFAATILASIIHTFNYKRDYYIPAAEVATSEEARTKQLAAAMSNTHINAGGAAALATREYHLAHEPHPENGTSLGFWLYLMSDCLIFAALFATYGVLGRSYAGGPRARTCSICRWWPSTRPSC
jgi:hypothetical protein